MNLVSIIIPYYKKKDFIDDAVKSILAQSHQNFEIIIIYDDPLGDDLGLIKKISKRDKRIILLCNSKNLGAGLSRNRGIKICKGKYISFLDADDIWKKNKLYKQIKFMEKNNCDFTHTSYQILKDRKFFLRRARNFFHINELIKSCDIGLSTVMIRSNVLKKYKFQKIKTKEDFVLWLKLLNDGYKIYALDKVLVTWRKTKNSLSSNIYQKFKDGFKVYRKYMSFSMIKSLYYLICLSINFVKK